MDLVVKKLTLRDVEVGDMFLLQHRDWLEPMKITRVVKKGTEFEMCPHSHMRVSLGPINLHSGILIKERNGTVEFLAGQEFLQKWMEAKRVAGATT